MLPTEDLFVYVYVLPVTIGSLPPVPDPAIFAAAVALPGPGRAARITR